jgi:hypothetical protein
MTGAEVSEQLKAHFGGMTDPRALGRCEHKLMSIIVIAIYCNLWSDCDVR